MGASHQVNISGREPDDDGLIDIAVSRSQARRIDQDAKLEDQKIIEKTDNLSPTVGTPKNKRRESTRQEEEWAYPGGGPAKRQMYGIYTYSNWRTNNISSEYYTPTNQNFDINDYPNFPYTIGGSYTSTSYINNGCGLTPPASDFGLKSITPNPADFTYSQILYQFKRSAYNADRAYLGVSELPPAHWQMAIVDLADVPALEASGAWIDKSSQTDYSVNVSFDDPNFIGHAWNRNFMDSLIDSSNVDVYEIAPPGQETLKTYEWGEDDRIITLNNQWNNKYTAMYSPGDKITESMFSSGSVGNQYEIPEWFVSHSPDGKTTWAYEIKILDVGVFKNGYDSWDDTDYDIYNNNRAGSGYAYAAPVKNNSWMYSLRKDTQEIWYTRIKFDHTNGTQTVENGKVGPFKLLDTDGTPAINKRYKCRNQDGSYEGEEPDWPSLHTPRYPSIYKTELIDQTQSKYNKYTGFHEYQPTIDQLWSRMCDEIMFKDDPSIEWRRQGYADDWVFDLENDTIIRTGIINRKRLLAAEGNVTTHDWYIAHERTNVSVKRWDGTAPYDFGIWAGFPPVPNAALAPAGEPGPSDLVSDWYELQDLLDSCSDCLFHGSQWANYPEFFTQHQLLHTFDPLAHQQFVIRVKIPGLSQMSPQEAGRFRHGIPLAETGLTIERNFNPLTVRPFSTDCEFTTWASGSQYPTEWPEGSTFEIQFVPQDEQWLKSFRRLIHSWYTQTACFSTFQSRDPSYREPMLGVRKMEDGYWAAGYYAYLQVPREYWYTDACSGYDEDHWWSHAPPFGTHRNLNERAGMWQFISNPFIAPGEGDPTLPIQKVRLGIQDFTVIF